jgi:hypothetical protein
MKKERKHTKKHEEDRKRNAGYMALGKGQNQGKN